MRHDGIVADNDEPTLTVIEAAVLGLLIQGPRHGFAIAKEFTPDQTIGSVFTASRPIVYRAFRTLTAKGCIKGDQTESSTEGPQRVVKYPSALGRREFYRWVDTPVRHTRDIRIHFLVKLALLDQLGIDPQPTIRNQYAVLSPIYDALQKTRSTEHAQGFDRVRSIWRMEHSKAVMEFFARISEPPD